MNVILIGGGEITKNETEYIDKYLLSKAGIDSSVLFLPAASNENENYIQIFETYFKSLGFKDVKSAKLSTETIEDMSRKFKESQIIYLGGGSPARLLEIIKTRKLDQEFKNFTNQECNYLVGMSAGAMILGDNALVSEPDEKIQLDVGIGILPDYLVLPHYIPQYYEKLKQLKKIAPNNIIVGIGEKSAVCIKDSKIIEIFGKTEIM